MTAQFHEGEEVEVEDIRFSYHEWRKAKVVEIWTIDHWKREYTVQFRDGARAVFDAAHIREVP